MLLFIINSSWFKCRLVNQYGQLIHLTISPRNFPSKFSLYSIFYSILFYLFYLYLSIYLFYSILFYLLFYLLFYSILFSLNFPSIGIRKLASFPRSRSMGNWHSDYLLLSILELHSPSFSKVRVTSLSFAVHWAILKRHSFKYVFPSEAQTGRFSFWQGISHMM